MKACINCGKILYDNAVICPKCKTAQPAVNQAASNNPAPVTHSPVQIRAKKQFDKEKLKKTFICIGIIIGVGIVAVFSLSIGSQIAAAKYIDKIYDSWADTINKTDISFEDFDVLEKEMDNAERIRDLNIFGRAPILFKLCKNYDWYRETNSNIYLLKTITICHEEYLKWLKDKSYKVSTLANKKMALLVRLDDSRFEENIYNEEYIGKYQQWLNEMKPSVSNVSISVSGPQMYNSTVDYYVTNDSAFEIDGFSATYSFTIWYFGDSTNFEQGTMELSNNDSIKPGEKKAYQETFNADDYYNSYSSYYAWQINSDNVELDSVRLI